MDQEGTPVRTRVSLLADFTAAKTPRPPGAWANTPAPAGKEELDQTPENPPPPLAEAETPVPAPANNTLSAIPTPAPPGAWQPTPAGSLRRKSILKVRFDVESNTSVDSMPEVPLVGPSTSNPADSISEVFPPLPPVASGSKQAAQVNPLADPPTAQEQERPTTPPTARARSKLKSPGLRVLDAFGREAVEESPVPSTSSSMRSDEGEYEVVPPNPAPLPISGSTPRSKSMVRIVDAMGHEVVDTEQPSVEETSVTNAPPMDRREALSRLRETVSQMADDLGDSDE